MAWYLHYTFSSVASLLLLFGFRHCLAASNLQFSIDPFLLHHSPPFQPLTVIYLNTYRVTAMKFQSKVPGILLAKRRSDSQLRARVKVPPGSPFWLVASSFATRMNGSARRNNYRLSEDLRSKRKGDMV